MILRLRRFCSSLDMGTFGVLTVEGEKFRTAERPWLNNVAYESCIPVGLWECERARFYQGDYDTLRVVAVPRRSSIKFHIGNQPFKDSFGCILVGDYFGALGGKWAVLDSTKAFKRFWSVVNDSAGPFVLETTFAVERAA